jgi:hypothetical protein
MYKATGFLGVTAVNCPAGEILILCDMSLQKSYAS